MKTTEVQTNKLLTLALSLGRKREKYFRYSQRGVPHLITRLDDGTQVAIVWTRGKEQEHRYRMFVPWPAPADAQEREEFTDPRQVVKLVRRSTWRFRQEDVSKNKSTGGPEEARRAGGLPGGDARGGEGGVSEVPGPPGG